MAEENLFDIKNTAPGAGVEPNLFTEATPEVLEPTSPTTLISSDDGIREIQDNEKFLDEVSPETAPGAEPPEPPSPDDNQFFFQGEGKKDEAPKEPTPPPTEKGNTFTLEEATEIGIDKFEQQTDGTFVLSEAGATDVGIVQQEIDLGAFGSFVLKENINPVTGEVDLSKPQGVFTPISPEQQAIQGITDQEMADAIAEARKRGLTINQPPATRTDSQGNILDDDLATIDEKLEGLINEFTSFDIDTDPDFQAQAATIRAQFAEMRNKMEKINASRQRALQSRGFRRGTAQFAGDIQAGIEGEELTQAGARITSINTAESAAISAARRAFKNDEIVEFNNQINAIQLLRQNKADEITKYNEALLAVNEKLQEEQDKLEEQIRANAIQESIFEIAKDGIVDPIAVFKSLKKKGITATAEEVKAYTSLMADFQKTVDATQDDFSDLTPSQRTQGAFLARQVYGTIRTKDQIEQFLNPIFRRMQDGESIDQIADDLRFAGQSPEFTGNIRFAAQQITSGIASEVLVQRIFDQLDDVLATGDIGQIQDFLKKMSIEHASEGVDEARKIKGEERTIELIQEIGQDLRQFEINGGDTNIFSGTAQQIKQKVGAVGDKALAKIATKISVAIINYRRAISGAAFNELEAEEYRDVFPSTKNVAELNSAKLEALEEVFQGDVDFFYDFAMGSDNYQKIFKEGILDSITPTLNDFSDAQINNTISVLAEIAGVDINEVSLQDVMDFYNIESDFGESTFNQVGSDTQSAAPVVGSISGLSAFDTFNTFPGVNRSDRNNNPGNIKVSSFTKQFEGVAGVESKPAEDGGNFLVFASTQDGINAVGRLLDTASPYQGVNAEVAIKRYNGNGGYGARDVGLDPNKDFQEQIKDPSILKRVVDAIMRLEGFTGVSNQLA